MSETRGFTPWIFREAGKRRAVIGWQFPDPGNGGGFGCGLKVTDDGCEIIAVMRPFRLAVPFGNFLLANQQSLDEARVRVDPQAASVDEPVAALSEADPKPVFVRELNNIRAEVLPTLIVNPPGYRVRIFVDGKYIVDILKDANPVPNPDGTPKPTPPYDIETAIARAKSMVDELQGWRKA